jgi:GNAT superfamily N-acetyltransferase
VTASKVRRRMSAEDLPERPYRSLWPYCRMLAQASDTAVLEERDGVIASVTPATPRRSVTNSVAYEKADALERALGWLGPLYAEAGVHAWTVWARGGDRAAERILDRAGHRLDATPAGMALELSGFAHTPRQALDLDPDPDPATIGAINDAAYGFDGDFSRAFARRPESLRLYVARFDGLAAACAGTVHEDGDCGVYMVATRPEFRGRGLAADLLAVALNEACEAGCETASLQSTAMGKPVYLRLGFRDFGPLEMWETRN